MYKAISMYCAFDLWLKITQKTTRILPASPSWHLWHLVEFCLRSQSRSTSAKRLRWQNLPASSHGGRFLRSADIFELRESLNHFQHNISKCMIYHEVMDFQPYWWMVWTASSMFFQYNFLSSGFTALRFCSHLFRSKLPHSISMYI